MSFPVYVRLGSLTLHPHWVFETLAYSAGWYLYQRHRQQVGDVVSTRGRRWLITAVVVGGFAGSRVLSLLEDPFALTRHSIDPRLVLGGKTIVGGLLGGLLAVEWTKRRLGIYIPTGDLFTLPLILGIAIGRIGCFLSGLDDQSYGVPTRLVWGVDFGDGIARHPTQLYEVAFLASLAALLVLLGNRLTEVGDRFKLFLLGYMGFRLVVDFLKPGVRVGGLSAIQWTCLALIAFYAPHAPRLVSAVRHG
jgi:phosphatidylglycerol:prolipoprotein diacylglycerol transferase